MSTKVEAIRKVLEDFGGKATLQEIYDNIGGIILPLKQVKRGRKE